jgi:trehalose 6-phosphate phosphatase
VDFSSRKSHLSAHLHDHTNSENALESGETVTSEAPDKIDRLEKFFCGFAGAARPHLLLDYDGTLAPFRVDRFQARPWAGVRELLARIQRQGSTRMAVVTGRPAAEIAPLLQLDPPLEVWGLHGAERLYPDGRRELEQAHGAARQILEELHMRLRGDSLGGLFEDKPNAAVMHWRGATPHKAKLIEQRTRELFEPLAEMDGLRLLEFEAGLELRVGRDKGGAVKAILEEAEAGSAVAYLGDDLTDEAAFRAVRRAGPRGLSLLVRREIRKTSADVWLRPPGELREFLGRWLRAVQGSDLSEGLVQNEMLLAV